MTSKVEFDYLVETFRRNLEKEHSAYLMSLNFIFTHKRSKWFLEVSLQEYEK